MSTLEALRAAVPCGDLLALPDGGSVCALGLVMHTPPGCAECDSYTPGLTALERTRCEVWTRVMGYHRPVSAFNAGRRAEHADRLHFREPGPGQAEGGEPPLVAAPADPAWLAATELDAHA
jgi:hypothetical protein